MKTRQAILVMNDIMEQHTNPIERRVLEVTIAALKYCEGKTYYIEEKRFK